jgi:hypothetical protein
MTVSKIVIVMLCLGIPIAIIGYLVYNVYDNYYGWGDTQPSSVENKLAFELIKPIPGLSDNEFSGTTEFEAVQQAASWVAANMLYDPDNDETWTPSDEQYFKTPCTGDYEDYAILLCALLRFHTQGGTISSDRVWVSANFENGTGAGTVVTQAWVGYKLEGGGLAYIEPRTGLIHRGRPYGTTVQ